MIAPACLLAAVMASVEVADGAYGRIEGDLALAGSLGAAASARGISGVVDLRLRYLQSAGIFATYEEGFGAGAEPLRALVTGIELRPLFLGRYFQGLELGSPHLDLLIDSFALEAGLFLAQPTGGNFANVMGFAFGFGLELPLLGRASGPFVGVHASFRFSQEALSAADTATVDVRAFVVSIVIGWQGIFGSHIVELGDTRRR